MLGSGSRSARIVWIVSQCTRSLFTWASFFWFGCDYQHYLCESREIWNPWNTIIDTICVSSRAPCDASNAIVVAICMCHALSGDRGKQLRRGYRFFVKWQNELHECRLNRFLQDSRTARGFVWLLEDFQQSTRLRALGDHETSLELLMSLCALDNRSCRYYAGFWRLRAALGNGSG